MKTVDWDLVTLQILLLHLTHAAAAAGYVSIGWALMGGKNSIIMHLTLGNLRQVRGTYFLGLQVTLTEIAALLKSIGF